MSVKLPMGTSKNSIAYRFIKGLVDQTKRRNICLFLRDHQEDRVRSISVIIDLNKASKAMKGTISTN